MPLPRNVLTVFVAAAAALMTLPANAQTTRPGLWEMTTKVIGSPDVDKAMALMQKNMANMPPEQRKSMEDMMAKQGLVMGAGANGFSTKICVTKEMADRSQMPMQQEGNCKNTISERTSSGLKMTYSCTNPTSSGEGQMSFTGDTGYTMKMKVNSEVRGKIQTMDVEGTGKFVSADCGDVKPLALPPDSK